MIKISTKKPITNIIINGEKLKAFPIRSETKQRRTLLSLLFNIILKVLTNAIRRGNIRYIDWKKRNKTVFVHR